MKRDMDLVREILLMVEGMEAGGPRSVPLDMEGRSAEELFYHVKIMEEADLISESTRRHLGQQSPYLEPGMLTWEGNEFLDASRDKGVWDAVKEKAAPVGGVTFDILKALLLQEIKDRMGI